MRDMLRSLLRYAGGVRIDHVLGMFRLWWIPRDAGPAGGTYDLKAVSEKPTCTVPEHTL